MGRSFRSLPRLMRAGLGLAVLGAAIDIGYHLATDAAGTGHGPVAITGHLVTLVGMVATMFGLLGAALKRRPVRATSPTKGPHR